MARCAALLACAVVSACGDASAPPVTPPVPTISGNWYFTDASAAPSPGQLNEIGAALLVQNGTVTGNATVAISDASGLCASYGLDLPLTGSVGPRGHLVLNATDNLDTLALSATVDPQHTALTSGSYTAIGAEAYPQTSPPPSSCTAPSGKLNGVLMPSVSASYVGTLATTEGTTVLVKLTMDQDTIPLPGLSHDAQPTYITNGNMVFLVGGFAVKGTMELTPSLCGVKSAKIEPQNGYVWGTVLQVEFDTDTTYHHGATFDTYMDPTTGTLNLVSGSVYGSRSCVAHFVAGSLLSRQG